MQHKLAILKTEPSLKKHEKIQKDIQKDSPTKEVGIKLTINKGL